MPVRLCLWAIPFVGWIIWICHALGASNRNVKNYARSFLCAMTVLVLLVFAVLVTLFVFGVDVNVDQYYEQIKDAFNNGMV